METAPTLLEQVHQAIEANFPADLAAIREFVRMPSISADGTGIAETAEEVKGFIEEIGGEAEVVPTDGHPVVYGELMVGRPKTLLIHGMYDVMPVEGEEWIVPPFSGEIVDLPDFGPCIVSRGILNSKGPLRGLLNAVAAVRQVDELPVNLKFVIEGEEERNSKHLPDFVRAYRHKIDSDAVFLPFFNLDSKGTPVTHLGTKGLIQMELLCQGGEWGGPRARGIHSSHGAWIASPLWRLIHALASMVDEDESIKIDGFFDDMLGPDSEEEELLARLEGVFDETKILDGNDVVRFKYDHLRGPDLLRHYLFAPVINIDGLVAGHTGAGIKTVIGHRATAKLDIRLVRGMTVEGTLGKVRDHLGRHGFEDVRVEVRGGYPSSRTSVSEPVVQAVLHSYRYHGYEPVIWPQAGGSGPFYLFRDELGLPLVMGGLCHGGNAHSANEYAVVDQIGLFEKFIATFLYTYASVPEGRGVTDSTDS